MKKLIERAESVIKGMRWRAFFILKRDDEEVEQEEKEYYGFNGRRCPPQLMNLNCLRMT